MRVYADIKGKKSGLEALEESQKELFESLPEESVCKKHFNLVKQVNDITRSTFDGNLNYLRMKYLDKKAVPATK